MAATGCSKLRVRKMYAVDERQQDGRHDEQDGGIGYEFIWPS
jgi:hypothetical protein